MRIIAGEARGVRLRSVPGLEVRPTTDRIKESLFQIIGPWFDGGLVLDLFAGTGSLGLEALSRGAERAVFTDRSRASVETIRHNLKAAGMEGRAEVYRRDARAALRTLARRKKTFRYIFLDPPYKEAILPGVLQAIAENDLLEPEGIIVAEHGVDRELEPVYRRLVRVRNLVYGDTVIDLYTLLPENPTGGGNF
ncbi:16S rRNA (guanine(966)-N(2))-methyltransferase RsmD [Melghirimyces profundicolus]|nr:16S rRNA (guanine(966)-N(2))-methyltransferase RsmD [Melghirimyces profundicolus]